MSRKERCHEKILQVCIHTYVQKVETIEITSNHQEALE